MEKVKIAIIDTGIDIYDSSLKEYIKYNNDIQITDDNINININDLQGHGTLCAKTIIHICKNVEIYPIKIFDEEGRTSSLNLIKSLNNLVSSDIDLINISASTLNSVCREELEYICDELYKNGKIIVCSHHNKSQGLKSYPTYFKSVIGVKGNRSVCRDEDYIFKKNEYIQMNANSKERFFKFNNQLTHFGKNSRAAAISTGIIANIYTRFGKISFDDLQNILVEESKIRTNYKKYRFKYKKSYKSNINKQKIAIRLVELINQNFSKGEVSLKFIEAHSILNNITQIGEYNAHHFLNSINEDFKINIDYKDIYIYELDNLYLLVDFIYSYSN